MQVKARCEGKPSCKLSPGNLPFNPRIRCNGWPRMWITYSCDGTSIDNTKVYIPPRPTTRRPWRPPPRRPPPRPGVGVVACFSENSIVETESGKKSMSSLGMHICNFFHAINLFSSWGSDCNLQARQRKGLHQG